MVNFGSVLQSPIKRTLLIKNKKGPLATAIASGQNKIMIKKALTSLYFIVHLFALFVNIKIRRQK